MAVLALAPVLDLQAATPLRALILAHRGADLDLDAGAVERLGGLCLQVLLSARRTWEGDGHKLRIVNASDPCADVIRLVQAGPALGLGV